MKIAHVMIFEKFIRSYIEFLDENFNINDHLFFIIGKDYKNYDLNNLPNVYFIDNPIGIPKFLYNLHIADKIIIHVLWDKRFIKLLLLQPWLIKKCYWMMWGGDFYNYENESANKKRLIGKIRHFISLFRGDFELVKKWYCTYGELHECIAYPVQLFEATTLPPANNHSGTTTILLGNSADPSNNHKAALELLKIYREEGKAFQIICPLSYGGDWQAKIIVKLGKDMFGDDFTPLTEYISFEKYNELLNNIDIAIFNHNRQQGVGNVTSMLAKGKKVFLNRNNILFDFFKGLDIEVYDIKQFDLSQLDTATRDRNIQKMKRFFSKENYLKQLNNLFYS